MTFLERIKHFILELYTGSEGIQQAAKGSPAVVGAAVTMNDIVTVITVIYVLIQIAYLVRKWWKEEKGLAKP